MVLANKVLSEFIPRITFGIKEEATMNENKFRRFPLIRTIAKMRERGSRNVLSSPLIVRYRLYLIAVALLWISSSEVYAWHERVSSHDVTQASNVPFFLLSNGNRSHAFSSEGLNVYLRKQERITSPLFFDGELFWSVSFRWVSPKDLRIYKLSKSCDRLEVLTPEMPDSLANSKYRFGVVGIIGGNDRFLYFNGDYRYDKAMNRLEAGHLDEFPEYNIISIESDPDNTWYLTDGRDAPGRPLRLIHHEKESGVHRVLDCGTTGRKHIFHSDVENLYVIVDGVRAMRISKKSLSIVEDLSHIRGKGEIKFFSASPYFYLFQIREGELSSLLKMAKDGSTCSSFWPEDLPVRFQAIHDDGERIWLVKKVREDKFALASFSKTTRSVQYYKTLKMGNKPMKRIGKTILWVSAAPVIIGTSVLWAPYTIILVETGNLKK